MLIQVPDVLTAEQVAHARHLLESAEWVDGKVTAGHQSARAKDNVQIRRASGRPRAGRDDRPGAAAQSALHLGGAAAPRLPAALQQLLGRPVVRQPRRQRDPPGAGHGPPDPHRPVVHAVPHRAPRSTTAASWWSRTPTASHSVKLPPGHLVLYPVDQPAPRAAGHARHAHLLVLLAAEHGAARRRSDAAVRPRRGDSGPARRPPRRKRRRCSSPACTTTCCGAGPSCKPGTSSTQRSFSRIELPTRSKAGPKTSASRSGTTVR